VDGRTVVASASHDETVRVWDAATGALVGDLFTGHSGPVNAVAIGQVDGRTVVASGSDDKTVRVWDAATGTPIADLPWQYGKAEASAPSKIDLAAWVLGIVYTGRARFAISTELGIVCLQVPVSSLHPPC
jgi:WD40 repeat protein